MKTKASLGITVLSLAAALAITVRPAAQETQQRRNNSPRYAVIDLGTLGGTFSQAFGINSKGSVVGYATLPNDSALHAFLWRDGVMIDLGTLGGSAPPAFSQASNVNDRDEVVGFSETSTSDPLGENFCGDSLVCLPFVWRDGEMSPLPTLGGTNGVGVSINNRSEVIGNAENPTHDPTCIPPQVLQIKPVIWRRAEVDELPTFPGDPDGIAASINDAGEATLPTGNCAFFGPPAGHDSLLRHGTLTDFGTFGGFPIAANDLNNRGQVVGVTVGPGGAEIEAVLWQKGEAIGLGTLPGDTVSIGSAINDAGQVTGQSCDSNGNCRGFLWERGLMTDLNALVPADSTLDLPDPTDINSRGQIVGLGVQKTTGLLHAFLLTPCDDEHANERGCEQADTSVARNETRESRAPIVPEKVRQLLQHQLHKRSLGAMSPRPQ